MKYKVIREHLGDKQYSVGDIREVDPNRVVHLIGKCLEPVGVEDIEPKKTKQKNRKSKNGK